MNENNENNVVENEKTSNEQEQEVKTYTQEEVLAMLAQVQNQKGEEK